VPSRANIAALRSIGVRTIIAFSAVGSLQEEIKPRDFVVPHQVIDRTKGIRPFTFWEGGAVSHVGFGDPFDEYVAKIVRACGHSLEGDGVALHDRGLLVCMGMVEISIFLLSSVVVLVVLGEDNANGAVGAL
jgi:5'-methylthioadenosine phosphorylase